MKKHLLLVAVLCMAMHIVGCQQRSDTPGNVPSASTTGDAKTSQLNFETLLEAVDSSIGKRYQSMQMEGMVSATYQYSGPIEKVVEIVAPRAVDAGFSEKTDSETFGAGPAEEEVQEKMGFDMKSVQKRVFTHPNGDVLTVMMMNISSNDLEMSLLTIQLMNPMWMAANGVQTRVPQSQAPSSIPTESGEVRALIDSWGGMGIYMPDSEQVEFLHENLSDVGQELEAALEHEDSGVRQRAAYAIAKIGPDAQGFGPSLFEQLKQEKEQLVRIYLIDALAAVRFKDRETLEFLRAEYDSLDEENVPPSMFGGGKYSEVDEKINLAGALFVLDDQDSSQHYYEFVTRWLAPPPDDMNARNKSGYWERRWMAVISLEGMRGATEAIPLLEAMLKEERAKSWVPMHVPRVLRVLRGN